MVAGDEPRSVLVGRDVLSSGGSAVDAMVAMAFSAAVTLPSSAGLGGGGICVVHDPDQGKTEALDFLPGRASDPTVAVPGFVRGMYALHAKYGALRWESLLAESARMARLGFPLSRAMAQRLPAMPPSLHAAALTTPMGSAENSSLYRLGLNEGDRVTQLGLASVIGRVQQRGAGDFYDGLLGRDIVVAANHLGLGLTIEDLRAYRPQWVETQTMARGNEVIHVPPGPLSAGSVLARMSGAAVPADGAGDRVPLAGADAAMLPESGDVAVQNIPGGTALVAADSFGSAAVCTLTMGRAYGAGIMLPDLGLLLPPASAARGAAGGTPITALLMVNPNVDEFFLGVGAAGADATALTAEVARILTSSQPNVDVDRVLTSSRSSADMAVADGISRTSAAARINVASCPDGVPPEPQSCSVAVDPRGAGYGVRLGGGSQ